MAKEEELTMRLQGHWSSGQYKGAGAKGIKGEGRYDSPKGWPKGKAKHPKGKGKFKGGRGKGASEAPAAVAPGVEG
jgi:hypothetical protein